MTPQTEKTLEMLQKLVEQLHKDNEVLQGLIAAYQTNVKNLIDLTTNLINVVVAESRRGETGSSPSATETT